MSTLSGVTRGGATWTPTFLAALDPPQCIGCGRCFKVCPREVLDLVERSEADCCDDEADEDNTMVMSIRNLMDCIGCGACGRVCPKGCLSHEALAT